MRALAIGIWIFNLVASCAIIWLVVDGLDHLDKGYVRVSVPLELIMVLCFFMALWMVARAMHELGNIGRRR